MRVCLWQRTSEAFQNILTLLLGTSLDMAWQGTKDECLRFSR